MVSRWRRCSSRSETHREYLRRYAPALRCPCFACVPAQSLPGLGVRRDNPFATHSLLRLGTGPSLPWLGRSPGRASPGHSPYSGSPTGLLSCSGSPCSACKSWACLPALRPCASRSLPLRTPCFAWAPAQAFRGLGVRRDERPPDTRLIPAHPPEPWQCSGSPMASPFGRENCHWHFSFLGLTPPGLAPASRTGNGLRTKRSSGIGLL
jgi:hypothetical protein